MRSVLLIVLAVTFASVAQGESFASRYNAANDLLREGKTNDALDAYRDLQIDDPESPRIYYGEGLAQYKRALDATKANEFVEGSHPFDEAKASFEKAQSAASTEVRRNARFNRANTIAQYAKHPGPNADQEMLKQAFEESIATYEEILEQDPDHKGARQNLDHMRYLLKKMLQNPPEDQQQDQQQGGDQNENDQSDEQQENQDQQSESDESQDEQHQQQLQQQQNEQDPSEQDESQQQDQPQTEQQQQPDEQQQEGGQQDQSPTTAQSDTEQQEMEPNDMQTVEALLQSLEDLDAQEQRQMRQARPSGQSRREWW
jgi:hypothetical protein